MTGDEEADGSTASEPPMDASRPPEERPRNTWLTTWRRRLSPRSVGMQVALVLALVFLPVGGIMIGVSALTYRESIHRNETEMLRFIARLSKLRDAQIARSALLAADVGRTVRDEAGDEPARRAACLARLERIGASEVWQTARLIDDAAGGDIVCAFASQTARRGQVDPGPRLVHTLSDRRRIEAVLAPLDLERPVGLERGLVGDFVDDWRPVAAAPTWGLAPWPIGTDGGPRIFSGRPADADDHTYALGARDRHGVASVLAIPSQDLYAPARERLFTTVGLLMTILLLGIVAAWATIEWVVLRRLRTVQDVAGRLASGDLTARVEAARTAPVELAALGHSVNDMAARIERRTREVEGAVRAQRRLLRELHHRVKNNFQVIASLLSLQRRALPPDQGDVLRYPEDHVAAMATAYRISYASGDIGDVALPELTDQVIAHILRSTRLPPGQLKGDIVVEGASVDLDSAVALGLLITQLMVPVCRAAAALDTEVQLDMLAGVSGLNVLVSGPAPDDETTARGGLPERFTNAFLSQIDAEMEVHDERPFYRARVRVPVERLTFARETD